MALNLFGRRRREEPAEPRQAPDPDSTSERTPEEQALLDRAREEAARRSAERRGEAEAVADLLGGMLSGPEPAEAGRGGAAAQSSGPRRGAAAQVSPAVEGYRLREPSRGTAGMGGAEEEPRPILRPDGGIPAPAADRDDSRRRVPDGPGYAAEPLVRESSRSTDVFDAERLAATHRGPPPEAERVAPAPAEPLVVREYSLDDLPGTDTVVLAPLPRDEAVPIDPNDTLLDGELIGADLLWDIDRLEDSAPGGGAVPRAADARPGPDGDDEGLDAALTAAADPALAGPQAPAAAPAMQEPRAAKPQPPPIPAEPGADGRSPGAARPGPAAPAPSPDPAAKDLSVRQLIAVERLIERDLEAEERRAAGRRRPETPPPPGWPARARLAAVRAVAALRSAWRAADRRLAPYSLSCEILMGIAGLITLSVIGAMSLRIWVFPR